MVMPPEMVANPRDPNADRYQAIAERYGEKEGIQGWNKRKEHSGMAWYGDNGERYISAPTPNSPKALYIFLHEVGHHHYKHLDHEVECGDKAGGSKEEYEATKWALEVMKKERVPISDDLLAYTKWNIDNRIKTEKRKHCRVDGRAVEFVHGDKSYEDFVGKNPWFFGGSKEVEHKSLKSGWSVGRASEEAYKAGYSGRIGFRVWLKSKKLDDRSQGQINLLARSYEDGMAKEDQDSRSKRGGGGHSGGGGHAGSGSGQVSSSGLEKEVASALVNYGAGSGEAREAAKAAVKGGGSFDAVFKRALDMVRHKQNPLGYGHWESFDSEKAAKQYARLMEGQGKSVTRHGKDVRVDEDNPARSGAQYRLAQAVLSGQSDAMPVSVARELVEKTPHELRSAWSHNPGYGESQGLSDFRQRAWEAGKHWASVAHESGVANARVVHYGFIKWWNNLSPQESKMVTKSLMEKDFREGYKVANSPRRRNPEPAAADMYESFHGRPSEQIVTFEEDEHYHEYLSELGVCCGLLVEKEDGKCVALGLSGYVWQGKGKDAGFVEGSSSNSARNPKRGRKGPILSSWDQANDLVYSGVRGLDQQLGKVLGNNRRNPGDSVGPNTTLLSSNEDGTQLYLVGGDQSLDLDDLDITGHMATKELITIGDVVKLYYETEKDFDKFEVIQYHHEVGEESGVLPILAYDRLNKRMLFVGGDYHIEKPMFETSPGLEN